MKLIVLDRDGRFLGSWGEGIFTRAHGIHRGPDGNLYLTDEGDHTVRACTPDGEVLLEIGVPGRPAGFMTGQPFHRCTHTALSPDGDIHATASYRRRVAATLAERTLTAALARCGGSASRTGRRSGWP